MSERSTGGNKSVLFRLFRKLVMHAVLAPLVLHIATHVTHLIAYAPRHVMVFFMALLFFFLKELLMF